MEPWLIQTRDIFFTDFGYVPFFGKRCVYGFRTFLELSLKYKVFPVGHGTNCLSVHSGLYVSPYRVLNHDRGHYASSGFSQYIVDGNKLQTEILPEKLDKLLIMYNFVLNSQDISYNTKLGVFIILFSLIHERPDIRITYEVLKRRWDDIIYNLEQIIRDIEHSGNNIWTMLKIPPMDYQTIWTNDFFVIYDELFHEN